MLLRQVKPGAAPLSELQSQLNDMLDDSASDDTASLTQLATLAAPMFNVQPASPPIMRQGTGVDSGPTASSMQSPQQMNSPQMMQQDTSTVLQQAAVQESQTAGIRAQLQVHVRDLLHAATSVLLLSVHCGSC